MRVNYLFEHYMWIVDQKTQPTSLGRHLYAGSSIYIAIQVGIMQHKNYPALRQSVIRDLEELYL